MPLLPSLLPLPIKKALEATEAAIADDKAKEKKDAAAKGVKGKMIKTPRSSLPLPTLTLDSDTDEEICHIIGVTYGLSCPEGGALCLYCLESYITPLETPGPNA